MTEILSKLYLELANVVPPEAISSREIRLKHKIDVYELALRTIAQDCVEPRLVAGTALIKIQAQE